jgi:hypothetical protein
MRHGAVRLGVSIVGTPDNVGLRSDSSSVNGLPGSLSSRWIRT